MFLRHQFQLFFALMFFLTIKFFIFNEYILSFLFHLVFKSFSLSLARRIRISNWTRCYLWYACVVFFEYLNLRASFQQLWINLIPFFLSQSLSNSNYDSSKGIGWKRKKTGESTTDYQEGKMRWTHIFLFLFSFILFKFLSSKSFTIICQFICVSCWRHFCHRIFPFAFFLFFIFFNLVCYSFPLSVFYSVFDGN